MLKEAVVHLFVVARNTALFLSRTLNIFNDKQTHAIYRSANVRVVAMSFNILEQQMMIRVEPCPR